MFERYKKVFKAILQVTKDYPKDLSYRGEGLSNEHRLLLPIGLIGRSETTSFTRVFDPSEEEIQTNYPRPSLYK
tara:strand:- start:100 stop:321 length:222 start_codon:yes stop_codon:yes gene_type:complete